MRTTPQLLLSIVALVILVALSGGMYWLYKEVSRVREAIPTQPKALEQPVQVAGEEEEEAGETPVKRQRWSALQSEFKDAVAQVFVQANEFNWVEPYKTPSQGEKTGSAFFINGEGDLITNAHVVDQAVHVAIQIPAYGKRRFTVEVLGVSPDRDLALLRVKKDEIEPLKKGLKNNVIHYLKMGDSDAVHRGDKLMALGYPLGQQGLKSTTGVVSGRESLSGQHLIQISAPINPGNSGGPSIDSVGRVIGVNSSGIIRAQNVGYVIPINDVRLFLEQLKTMPAKGTGPKLMKKPYLGVFFNNGNDNLTEFLKNPAPGGLYVVDVTKGSPFDKAGIKAQDMLYKFDGYPVDIYGEMTVPWSKEDRISVVDYVSRLKLGSTLKIDYYRNGIPKKASIVLTTTDAPIRQMYPGYEKIDYEVIGGYVFMPLSLNHVVLLAQYAPELMIYADPKKQTEPAVLVTHAMLNSPASRTRTIGAGGIVKEVNGQRVKTLDELRDAVQKAASSGYLTIKTTDNQFAALPVSEILEDEERLSATYHYPISQSFKHLKGVMGK